MTRFVVCQGPLNSRSFSYFVHQEVNRFHFTVVKVLGANNDRVSQIDIFGAQPFACLERRAKSEGDTETPNCPAAVKERALTGLIGALVGHRTKPSGTWPKANDVQKDSTGLFGFRGLFSIGDRVRMRVER